jgi:DNA modification methylase
MGGEWQQSPLEAQHVISKLTIEGDVVLDPLMGSGTAGIAALKEGRKFIGIDKDAEVLQKGRDRIGSMLSSHKNSGSMGEKRE